MMKILSMVALLFLGLQLQAQEPDYSAWTRILRTHYDRVEGMDYEGLAQRDWATMKALVQTLDSTDTTPMTKDQQLAYYLNLYNITVVNLLMENRQVHSIRDLSTDPIIRFNIFRKDLVLLRAGRISLKRLEDEFIRAQFKDPRIHFAINCAARSCPPMRMEAFTGAGLQAQLDEQTRAFFAHPKLGARLERTRDALIVHLTKIMDSGSWFGEDFEQWGGGRLPFLRKHLATAQQKVLDEFQGKGKLQFDAYDWSLNRWKR